MLPEIAPEELTAVVEEVAWEVLGETRWTAPPVDAMAVAGRLGMSIAWDYRQHARARYVRLRTGRERPAGGVILLRPEPREERRQWAVAHEIGEHAAQRVFRRLRIDAREAEGSREAVANGLARSLLLPAEWFMPDLDACGWDLAVLKERYATASHELIARRMLDFPPAAIISIFDHGALTFRAGSGGGRPPPLSPLECCAWETAHDENRPAIVRRDAFSIQAWPIHEPGWPREIVRTVVEE